MGGTSLEGDRRTDRLTDPVALHLLEGIAPVELIQTC